jgi:hypothetical protein
MIQYLAALNFKHMRVKIIGEKMLAQCPKCKSVKMQLTEKYRKDYWQKSIAKFNNLKEELCHECK